MSKDPIRRCLRQSQSDPEPTPPILQKVTSTDTVSCYYPTTSLAQKSLRRGLSVPKRPQVPCKETTLNKNYSLSLVRTLTHTRAHTHSYPTFTYTHTDSYTHVHTCILISHTPPPPCPVVRTPSCVPTHSNRPSVFGSYPTSTDRSCSSRPP